MASGVSPVAAMPKSRSSDDRCASRMLTASLGANVATAGLLDLDDVPEEVRDAMTFHPVMSIDEVLELALEPAPATALAA